MITREAVKVIHSRHASTSTAAANAANAAPLFLWVSYTAPHRPLEADPAVLARQPSMLPLRLRVYAAMIGSLDDGVGQVRLALASRGMLNRTVLVFLSDNGGPIQREGCNGGLRGGKGTAYEGGVRVPAFVYFRPCLAPSLTDVPMAIWDWLPTLVHAAGVEFDAEVPPPAVMALAATTTLLWASSAQSLQRARASAGGTRSPAAASMMAAG